MLANKIWYQTAKATAFPKRKIYFTRNFLYTFLIETSQKLPTNNSKTGALFQLELRMSKSVHIPQHCSGDPGHYKKDWGKQNRKYKYWKGSVKAAIIHRHNCMHQKSKRNNWKHIFRTTENSDQVTRCRMHSPKSVLMIMRNRTGRAGI